MDDINNAVLHNYYGGYRPTQEKADISRRIGAFLIDHTVICLVLLPPFTLFFIRDIESDPYRMLRMLPILFLIMFIIYSLRDIVRGNSLGKYLLGIAVRNPKDITAIPPISKLFLRNIFTVFWPVELLVLVCSAKKTKIGDKITGTEVYHISNKSKTPAIVVTVVLVASVFVGALVFGISAIIKNDSSYKAAIDYIQTNPAVLKAVGDIEGYGFMPTGSINVSGEYGRASFVIKLIGSERTVRVNIQLIKEPGKDWEVTLYLIQGFKSAAI